MRTFVVVIPAELVAQFLQSLDRVSGTVVGLELLERAVIQLKRPAGLRVAGARVELVNVQCGESLLEVHRLMPLT